VVLLVFVCFLFGFAFLFFFSPLHVEVYDYIIIDNNKAVIVHAKPGNCYHDEVHSVPK
jgi:hypothetical protein